MDISIGEKHLAHIRKLIDSGRYSSADALIDRALALLEERDLADSDPVIAEKLADVRSKVMQGLADLKSGRHTKYETAEQLVADVRQRAKERRDRETALRRALIG